MSFLPHLLCNRINEGILLIRRRPLTRSLARHLRVNNSLDFHVDDTHARRRLLPRRARARVNHVAMIALDWARLAVLQVRFLPMSIAQPIREIGM